MTYSLYILRTVYRKSSRTIVLARYHARTFPPIIIHVFAIWIVVLHAGLMQWDIVNILLVDLNGKFYFSFVVNDLPYLNSSQFLLEIGLDCRSIAAFICPLRVRMDAICIQMGYHTSEQSERTDKVPFCFRSVFDNGIYELLPSPIQ